MTVENQSSIRFSVEESIWFKKGQEVSELLSMSLDPEIIIQEHEQYISVRGGLVLTGEYRAQGMDEEDSSTSLPEGGRTVQESIIREDGISVLKHSFPVDITIPKNRIQNLNDVYVTIEAFDYELPSRENLMLEADLSISGIHVDQQKQQQENEFSQNFHNDDESMEGDSDFLEEVMADSDEEDVSEEELVQPLMRGSLYDEDLEEVEQDQNPFTPFVVEAKRDMSYENSNELGVEPEQEEPFVLTRQTPQFEFKSRVEEPIKDNEKEYVKENDGNRDENSLSLTNIFAKEDEDETTRLKMCIVQKDESIESIASRYGVQAQALIRVNHLDREHLAEGQILYIPVLTGSRK